MPLTEDPTSQFDIPRPQADGSDDANVPHYVRELADRVEALLRGDADSGAIWAPGDFKFSSRSASHGRWLLCDGTEKTQAEIEAALGLDAGEGAALATLWGTGGASIYGAAAVGKVKLPDPRNRSLSVVGPAGLAGLTERVRGAAYGAETVTLTAAQSGVRDHAHGAGSLAAAAHNHGKGTLAIPNHTHNAGTLAIPNHSHDRGTLAAPDHSHPAGTLYTPSHAHGIFFNTGGPGSTANIAGASFFAAAANHIHLVSGDTAYSGDIGVGGSTGSPTATSLASGVTGTVPSVTQVAGATHATPSATALDGAIANDGPHAVTGSVDAVTTSHHASNGDPAEESHTNIPPSFALGSLFVRV